MGSTFDRATGNPPFDVAPAFAAEKAAIDPAVTYDFVTTNDIIGGGSMPIDEPGTVIGAALTNVSASSAAITVTTARSTVPWSFRPLRCGSARNRLSRRRLW